MERPRVLIYGAGVLGCLLAHQLEACRAAEVTLLARGAWADTLRHDGLTMRHWVQCSTTVDRVRIVSDLAPDDVYDAVFVAVQATQIGAVLPVLAANASPCIVFMGNNVSALETQRSLATCIAACGGAPKAVTFGFQSSGGRREDSQVVSIHLKPKMTLGGADGELSSDTSQCLARMLESAGYALTWEHKMDAWLKCHAAYVLPIAFTAYACGCDLKLATRGQRREMLDATREMYGLLMRYGTPIRPEGDEAFFQPGTKRMLMSAFTWGICKTPLGPLVATDHCRNAVAEMRYLTQELEAPFDRDECRTSAPTWWALKERMPAWEKLLDDPRCGTGA